MKTCDWVFQIPADKRKNVAAREVIFRRLEKEGRPDRFISFIFTHPKAVFPGFRREYDSEADWRKDMRPFDRMALKCPAIKTYKESEAKSGNQIQHK